MNNFIYYLAFIFLFFNSYNLLSSKNDDMEIHSKKPSENYKIEENIDNFDDFKKIIKLEELGPNDLVVFDGHETLWQKVLNYKDEEIPFVSGLLHEI